MTHPAMTFLRATRRVRRGEVAERQIGGRAGENLTAGTREWHLIRGPSLLTPSARR